MNFLARAFIAVAAIAGLAGCATYDYGYSYSQPYYYGHDYGPAYYEPYYAPGYYVAPPVIGFSYRYYGAERGHSYDHRDRWRHSDWSGSRAHVAPRTTTAVTASRDRVAPARVAGASRGTRANAASRSSQRAERLAARDEPRG